MELKPVYIVGGMMRCGTSMMMKALKEGGMDLEYDRAHYEKVASEGREGYYSDDYDIYEVDPALLETPWWVPKIAGKVIKMLGFSTMRLPVYNYKVIWMTRNPEEIKKSHDAWFGNGATVNNYDYINNNLVAILNNRKDTQVFTFDYHDVLDHPKDVFKFLRSQGWPIDVDKAAAVIDPSKNRIKL